MVHIRTLTAVSIALSVILAVISFLDENWMWLIVDVLCVLMLVLPHLMNLGFYYRRNIVWASMAAPIGGTVIALVNMLVPLGTADVLEVNTYSILVAIVQAYQCYIIGLMFAIILDRNFGLTMTPSWMGIFALAFCMSMSGLDMFFTFGEMYADGYDVFDDNFFQKDTYTNGILMVAPLVSMPVSVIVTIYLCVKLYSSNKSVLIVDGEGRPFSLPHMPENLRMPSIPVPTINIGHGIRVVDVVALVIGILLVALSLYHWTDNSHAAIRCMTSGTLCFIPPALNLLKIVRLPTPLILLIVLAVSMHGIGLVSGAYITGGDYDTITHITSSLCVTSIIFYALIIFQHFGGDRVNFTGWGLALLCGLLSISFSLYWEIFEYCSDVFTENVAQYSPYDTLTDLVCDGAGVLLASIWVGLYMRCHTSGEIVESFSLNKKLTKLASVGWRRI